MIHAGQLVAGRYRVISSIGEGAMASVWRASDETLQREVAIKVMYTKGTRDPHAMIEQFLREARIAAAVQHRNVIQTVDFGALDDEQPFMVMELLNGETLADRLARKPPLDRQQIVDLITLTLRGLAAVHDAGIVHRDLKPANIFLQRDADAVYPKILDFGISRSVRQGVERPSAISTQDGMIIGTPDYMSPEQARGETDIDKRADVYAMGVILYRGLTGRLPFLSDTVGELLVQILTATPPRVRDLNPDVDSALSAMVEQAMARNRDDRFADARALRRALRGAMKRAALAERRASESDPQALGSAPAGGRVALPTALASPHFAPTRVRTPDAPDAPDAPLRAGGGWGDIDLDPGAKRQSAAAPITFDPPPAAPSTPARSTPRTAGAARATPANGASGARAGERSAPPSGSNLELAESPSPAARGGTRPAAKDTSSTSSDMLNPLYQGKHLPALDIDYARVRSDGGAKDRVPSPDAARSPRTGARARSGARPAAQDAPAATEAGTPRPRLGVSSWLLALGAMALAVYLLARPSHQGQPSEIRPEGPDARALVKNRRANLKNVPPHLRDVRF